MSQTAGGFRQDAKINVEWRIAGHAGAGRIDDQRGTARHSVPVAQCAGFDRRLYLRAE